jgi:hypothetical protein
MAGVLLRCKIREGTARKRPTGRHLKAVNDNYETPAWAWQELFVAMPTLRKKFVWDPFYCNGATKTHWKNIGVTRFVHSRGDFFRQVKKLAFDVVVTNPPFSIKQLILDVLVSSGRPFVVLLRTSVLFTLWFRRLIPVFKLVLPSKQVDFCGMQKQKLTFDCVFVCVGFDTRVPDLVPCPRLT